MEDVGGTVITRKTFYLRSQDGPTRSRESLTRRIRNCTLTQRSRRGTSPARCYCCLHASVVCSKCRSRRRRRRRHRPVFVIVIQLLYRESRLLSNTSRRVEKRDRYILLTPDNDTQLFICRVLGVASRISRKIDLEARTLTLKK